MSGLSWLLHAQTHGIGSHITFPDRVADPDGSVGGISSRTGRSTTASPAGAGSTSRRVYDRPGPASEQGDHAEAGGHYGAAPVLLDQPAASGQQDKAATLRRQLDDARRGALGAGTDLAGGLLIVLLFAMVGVARYAYGPGYAEAMLIGSATGVSIRLLLERRRLKDGPPSTEGA